MNEPNPYAPPAVHVGGELPPSTGPLWRITSGRLQVRNMASLPDVCVCGDPQTELGVRSSIVLESLPLWVKPVLFLGIVIATQLTKLDWSIGVVLIMLAIFLPGLFAKRVKLMIFRSRRSERSVMIRKALSGVIFIAVFWASLNYGIQWKWDLFGLHGQIDVGMLALVCLFMDIIPGRGPSRVITLGDAWFEVKGTHPDALAKLEEIQGRVKPSHPPA